MFCAVAQRLVDAPRLPVIAAALMLGACAPAPQALPDDYFPLADGHAWTYRMTTARDDDVPEERGR